MKIEKLNEDKIRITLDINDLKENNIDFHSFMSNSLDSQSIFLDMLEKAEEEVGFTTRDYRIMIEALATSEGNFILTVTRMAPDLDKETMKKKKVKIRRKSVAINKDIAVYEFNSFDDVCDFSSSLSSNLLAITKKNFSNSTLYTYNNKFYLTFSNISATPVLLKTFSTHITEFASYVHNSKSFNHKLMEYGKILIKKDAIKLCVKHFSH